jgi:hypothetical protein
LHQSISSQIKESRRAHGLESPQAITATNFRSTSLNLVIISASNPMTAFRSMRKAMGLITHFKMALLLCDETQTLQTKSLLLKTTKDNHKATVKN